MSRHKNDMYGNIDSRSEADPGVLPPIPAATVLLLRQAEAGLEVLMLKKNSKISFGGMWVFPGGKIDAADAADGMSGEEFDEAAARNAAAREAQEEAGVDLDPEVFAYFAHWTPPPGPQKRFTTWFFAADVTGKQLDVDIDDGEIKDSAWLSPATALERHAKGEIEFVPPTWVTIYHLAQLKDVAPAMERFSSEAPRVYATHVGKAADGNRVAMWYGDAGYDAWDPDVDGARHRLVMAPDGFVFENDVEVY